MAPRSSKVCFNVIGAENVVVLFNDKGFPWGDGEIFWDVLLVIGDTRYAITDRVLEGLGEFNDRVVPGDPARPSRSDDHGAARTGLARGPRAPARACACRVFVFQVRIAWQVLVLTVRR